MHAMCLSPPVLSLIISLVFRICVSSASSIILLPTDTNSSSNSNSSSLIYTDPNDKNLMVLSGLVLVRPIGSQYGFGTPSTAFGHIRGANVSSVVCKDVEPGRRLIKSEEWLAKPSATAKVVWFDDCTCKGDEIWIGDCAHTGLGRGHRDDGDVIGVTCFFEANNNNKFLNLKQEYL